MRSKISYEWSIEELDPFIGDDGLEDFDIVDNQFADSISEYSDEDLLRCLGKGYNLSLNRRAGNDADGQTDHLWIDAPGLKIAEGASFTDGQSETGHLVPQKYIKQLAARVRKLEF